MDPWALVYFFLVCWSVSASLFFTLTEFDFISRPLWDYLDSSTNLRGFISPTISGAQIPPVVGLSFLTGSRNVGLLACLCTEMDPWALVYLFSAARSGFLVFLLRAYSFGRFQALISVFYLTYHFRRSDSASGRTFLPDWVTERRATGVSLHGNGPLGAGLFFYALISVVYLTYHFRRSDSASGRTFLPDRVTERRAAGVSLHGNGPLGAGLFIFCRPLWVLGLFTTWIQALISVFYLTYHFRRSDSASGRTFLPDRVTERRAAGVSLHGNGPLGAGLFFSEFDFISRTTWIQALISVVYLTYHFRRSDSASGRTFLPDWVTERRAAGVSLHGNGPLGAGYFFSALISVFYLTYHFRRSDSASGRTFLPDWVTELRAAGVSLHGNGPLGAGLFFSALISVFYLTYHFRRSDSASGRTFLPDRVTERRAAGVSLHGNGPLGAGLFFSEFDFISRTTWIQALISVVYLTYHFRRSDSASGRTFLPDWVTERRAAGVSLHGNGPLGAGYFFSALISVFYLTYHFRRSDSASGRTFLPDWVTELRAAGVSLHGNGPLGAGLFFSALISGFYLTYHFRRSDSVSGRTFLPDRVTERRAAGVSLHGNGPLGAGFFFYALISVFYLTYHFRRSDSASGRTFLPDWVTERRAAGVSLHGNGPLGAGLFFSALISGFYLTYHFRRSDSVSGRTFLPDRVTERRAAGVSLHGNGPLGAGLFFYGMLECFCESVLNTNRLRLY
ncbi:hypothetical protein BDR26DRAFT_921242 [Obelidium mucronatum]|nr:hypothetical protein BDR26DRAFT_921242 [Obelidium mucronatum]